MGGYVALNLAKKFPHCVENIVTYGTQFKWTPESATKEAQLLNPEKIDLKVPAFAKQLKTTHGSAWKEVVNKTKKMMLDLGNEPTLKIDDFETISHHILLTLGAKDNMADLEETLHVNRTLQDSQFMPIPNMPHPLNQVKPEVLVPLLLKHL
jgi:esterase/lipase